MESATENKDLRHNYAVNLLDGAFFGFGIGFASFSTILPLFISTLTNSNLLIGLVPAIHNSGVQLPQLFTAKRLRNVRNFLAPTMRATIHERLPFLGLALTAFLVPLIGTEVALVLSFICLVWQGLGAGFTGNPWQNMLSRVIPQDYLATFFGLQAAASNMLASVGAVAAGFILESLSTPPDFSVVFIICFSLLMVSYFFLQATREPDREITSIPAADLSLSKSILAILRKDRPFLWFLITRNLFQFGTMAFSFYIIYGVRRFAMSETTAGVMTSILLLSQMIANPLMGWVADHLSRRRVFIAGAMATCSSALLAWMLPDIQFFFLVFILASMGNVTFWTIGMAYTLDFGTEGERPTYVGMANTLIAPSAILAPLVGGWIADSFGYQATFITAAFCSALTVLVLRFLVPDLKKSPA
jgi:MFS family permease